MQEVEVSRRRPIALLFVFLLLLAWAGVIWTNRQSEKQGLQEIRRESSALALLFANHTDTTFRQVDHALQDFQEQWLHRALGLDALVASHRSKLEGAIIQISVVDAEGYLAYNSLGMPDKPLYLGDREHFVAAMQSEQNRLFVSRPTLGRISGKWSIQLSRPIFKNAERVGVAVASVDPDYFVKFYGQAGLGDSGAAYMVRDTGEIMARSSAQEQFIGKVIQTAPYAEPGAPQQGSFRRMAQIDDVDRLSSYYHLPQYGLTVVIGPGVDERMAPVREHQRHMVLAAAALTLLMAVIVWQLLSNMRRELSSQQAMRQVHALHEADRILLRTLLNTQTDLVWLKSAEGVYLDCNARFEQFFGVPREQIVGKTDFDFVEPKLAEFFREKDLAAMHADAAQRHEEWIRFADGHRELLETTKTPMRDSTGQRIGVLGFGHDITERKQEELQHLARNKVLRLLTDGEPVEVILQEIIRNVDAERPELQCCILLLDAEGQHLQSVAAQGLQDCFLHKLQNKAIGPLVGSSGRAAYLGERVVVEDVHSNRNWDDFLNLAESVGIRSCWSQPFKSRKGKVLGTFTVYHREVSTPSEQDVLWLEDIAMLTALAVEKSRDESKLKLAASVFTHAREGIMITDAQGCIITVNETFSRITGFDAKDVIGKKPSVLKSGRQNAAFYQGLWHDIITHGFWSGEVWNRRKSGEVFAENLAISAVRDADQQIQNYVALFTDITSLKDYQDQLERIAHYDALTGLPNRVLFADRLAQALLRSQRHKKALSVVYLDLDGFKAINDTYGHACGDELLIALAQRMKAALREQDSLARIGGDEFVAVLVDLEAPSDSLVVLERLLQAAAEPVTLYRAAEPAVVRVSASAGSALYPLDGLDADMLLRNADHAMYRAKQSGKNRFQLFEDSRLRDGED
jgi:diguanylate cyclase (GGDEF)-like protein/PAS domain S-box-containing protein